MNLSLKKSKINEKLILYDISDRGGNEFYYLGSKIVTKQPWKRCCNIYIPAGALHSWERWRVMHGKLTEWEQASQAREERWPRRESPTPVLLRGRPQI